MEGLQQLLCLGAVAFGYRVEEMEHSDFLGLALSSPPHQELPELPSAGRKQKNGLIYEPKTYDSWTCCLMPLPTRLFLCKTGWFFLCNQKKKKERPS